MIKLVALILASLGLFQAMLTATFESSPGSTQELRYRIGDRSVAHNVPRIGVNLGGRTSWGAEQLMGNVLANSGFEPTLDGAIAVVRGVSGREFTDDTPWLARPVGFWQGASFSVRTGPLAGLEGTVIDSGEWQSYPHFLTDRKLTGLASGDVIALSKTTGTGLPSHWWWQNEARIHVSGDLPSHSTGRQSLLMAPDGQQSVAAISYLDMISDRAGRLLPLPGRWTVTFWAKGLGDGRLTAQVKRLNSAPYLRETIHPGSVWRQYHFVFVPLDDGSPAGLEFRLDAEGTGSQIWIDDVSLEPLASTVSGFRREVVETLKQLHPGYLRDWQGQLGDSLNNRLATPGARQPFRYRPGDETAFAYSLPEFLALCHEVGADPWIVFPTTLRDDEWTAAGKWLKTELARYEFHEIVLEFGNENWNAVFRPAGIQDIDRMAEAAARGFRLLSSAAAHDSRLYPAIGAQFVNPQAIGAALHKDHEARLVAIAPYYATSFAKTDGTEDSINKLFLTDDAYLNDYSQLAQRNGKHAAIYEINAHSLGGDAALEDVSRLVTSAAAGSAILFHAMRAMDGGVYRQCLYSLAGFDTVRSDGKLVRLFGLARDLSVPNRLRPTGLAMEMANRVIDGDSFDVVPVIPSGGRGAELIAARAFRGVNGWSILIASASPKPVEVEVEIPAGTGRAPNVLFQLASASPLANNEDTPGVTLQREPMKPEANHIRIYLGPFGAAAAYCEPPAVPDRNGATHHGSRP